MASQNSIRVRSDLFSPELVDHSLYQALLLFINSAELLFGNVDKDGNKNVFL